MQDVHWFVGKSAPSFYYNLLRDHEDTPCYAQAIVQLAGAEASPRLIQALQSQLDAEVPEARVLVRQLEQGPPVDAPLELRLYGPDRGRLAELGDEVRAGATVILTVLFLTELDLRIRVKSFSAEERGGSAHVVTACCR